MFTQEDYDGEDPPQQGQGDQQQQRDYQAREYDRDHVITSQPF